MKIQCRTTFDITATGVTGHFRSSRLPFTDLAGKAIANERDWNRSRNQQRNWETLQQLISLRTQVNIQQPIKTADCWEFEFDFETHSVFDDGTDLLGTLKADCFGVPMLTRLEESQDPGSTLCSDQNIWFTVLE